MDHGRTNTEPAEQVDLVDQLRSIGTKRSALEQKMKKRFKGVDMGVVTLAAKLCAPACGYLPRSTKPIPPSTAPSQLTREARVKKIEASGTVEEKGMKGHRQTILDEQPNID